MAYRERQKISQMLPKSSNIENTDLFETSVVDSGSYITRSITGQEIIDGVAAGISGSFVPYTGATQDVDLDANKLSAEAIYIEGTNGAGHLHLKHQNSDATATGQSTALYADLNGDLKYKNDNDYYTTLKTSSNTADRVYTYPDASGTLALQDAEIVTLTSTLNNLVASHAYKLLKIDNSAANDLRIPTNVGVPFPIGTQIIFFQYGTGQVTIAGTAGVTLRSSGGKTKTAAQYAMGTLIKIDTNEWVLSGDLTT
jgi:hypothetical protein